MSEPDYQNWGRARSCVRRMAIPVEFGPQGARFPTVRCREGFLPFGNGRSYGDSCHNDPGLLVDMRVANRILSFDPETGLIEAQAGTLLCDSTRHGAAAGWFLPVTPGTQFVTLGGAIANDVHGKNHHRRGTFGAWVRKLTLLRSSQVGAIECSPTSDAALFGATVGGMGLTGIIASATVQLMKVPSLSILQTTHRFETLADYFALAEEADARHEYAVAWIDSLKGGQGFGRGHLICGDHAEGGDFSGQARRPLASVPFTPPLSPLRGLPLRAFNEAYFRKARPGVTRREVPFDAFFYPLDRIGGWNRLYGPRGLHQHQSVVPFRDAQAVIGTMLRQAARDGQGSFLTVLKRFSAIESPGVLSFPRAGYTLTLDLPHKGEATLRLLSALDRIVVEAGGAVNPYKDARMSPETFAASFPRWLEVETLRDPPIVSDFWRRTALSLASAEAAGAHPIPDGPAFASSLDEADPMFRRTAG